MTNGEIELIDYGTREAWMAGRRLGIGASESAALFGVSPWDTPVSLWAKKMGIAPDDSELREHVEWGNLLEGPIATRYEQKTGRTIWQGGPFQVAQHPRIACMRATPDRWVVEAPDHEDTGLLQAKNTNAFTGHNWKDGPPDFIKIQVQHEMAVTGVSWESVAVLIGGSKFMYFDIERNEAFIEELEQQCQLFWGYVTRGEQPPLDDRKPTFDAIKRLHPKDNGQEIPLPDEAEAWWAEMQQAKLEERAAKKRAASFEVQLRNVIGDASYGRLPNGRRLTLLTTERKGYSKTVTVRPSSSRTLRIEKDFMPWKNK